MQPNSMEKIPNKLPGSGGWSFGKFSVISHLPSGLHCHRARIKKNPLYISTSTITHLYKADLGYERNMEIIFTKDIINFELCS